MASPKSNVEKTILDLELSELQEELEKRDQDKNGTKTDLIERLSKKLKDDGEDPGTFLFITEGVSEDQTELETNPEDNNDSTVEKDNNECKDVEMENDTLEQSDKEAPVDNTVDEMKYKSEVKESDQVTSTDGIETDCAPTEAKQNLKESEELDPGYASPTSADVITSFTVEDTIALHSSSHYKADDESMVVNVDSLNGSAKDLTFDEDNLTAQSDSSTVKDNKNVCAETLKDSELDEDTSDKNDSTQSVNGSKEKSSLPGADAEPSDQPSTNEDDKQQKDSNDTDKIESQKDSTTTAAAASIEDNDQKAGDKPSSTVTVEEKKKAGTGGIPKDSSRNLWVSGLCNSTKATDLKDLFTKYGKVSGAKVVTNAKSPGSRCYGFVTMANAEQTTECLKHLHRTELHGRMISVERAKSDPASTVRALMNAKKGLPDQEDNSEEKTVDNNRTKERRPSYRSQNNRSRSYYRGRGRFNGNRSRRSPVRSSKGNSHRRSASSRKDDVKSESGKDKEEKAAEGDKAEDKTEGGESRARSKSTTKKGSKSPSRSRSKSNRNIGRDRRDHEKQKLKRDNDMLSFEKIRAERERERLLRQVRQLREEDRQHRKALEIKTNRQREAERRQREAEKRQREENFRIQQERDMLRMERERLERARIEAERMKYERDLLEREKVRLARERHAAKMEITRLEEERRATKRTFESRQASREDSYHEPKRVAYDNYANKHDSEKGRTYGERPGRNADRYERNRDTQGRASNYNTSETVSRGSRVQSTSNITHGTRETAMSRYPHNSSNNRSDERRSTTNSRDMSYRSEDSRSEWKSPQNTMASRLPRNYSGSTHNTKSSNSWNKSMDSDSWHSPTETAATNNTSWSSSQGRSGHHSSNVVSSRSSINDSSSLRSNDQRVSSNSNSFLSSAANIMLGVGMMSTNRSQEQRYDAYQNSSSERRY